MTPPRAAAARAAAPGRRPLAPRRVSGPVRRPAPALPALAPARPAAVQGMRRVVDHPILDRIIRGRTWIGVVAFALIGIVGMQVALLKLNTGIGRSVDRSAVLQRANSLLAMEVSTLRAGYLRQAEAAHPGMVYAPPGAVRYLTAGAGDAAQAAATMAPPRALSVNPASGSAVALGPTSTGSGPASSLPAAGSSASSGSGPGAGAVAVAGSGG